MVDICGLGEGNREDVRMRGCEGKEIERTKG